MNVIKISVCHMHVDMLNNVTSLRCTSQLMSLCYSTDRPRSWDPVRLYTEDLVYMIKPTQRTYHEKETWTTVVPALGDPRRERPPAVYGHFVNVPTHFNVKLPVISGHLPNADADSHLLVVSTCYNGQCKQMSHFRWSFQQQIAGAHPNVGPTVRSNFRAVVW